MSNRTRQRSGLPLLFLSAFLLAVAAGLVILFVSPFTGGFFPGGVPNTSSAGQPTDTTQHEPPPEPSPPPEPAAAPDPPEPPAPPPAPARPGLPTAHTVVRGDTLFDLAGAYWSDHYLWPALLVANAGLVTDPDLLRPGTVLSIATVPEDAEFLTFAHMEAYRRYRVLGDDALARGRDTGNGQLALLGAVRINKAHWVLYSGLRYDDNLVENAAGVVPEADLAVVRGFMRRYGPAPGM